jgi:hypothetical protein
MHDVGTLCGPLVNMYSVHLVYFMVIWYILWSFGIFYAIWYVVPKTIWQLRCSTACAKKMFCDELEQDFLPI